MKHIITLNPLLTLSCHLPSPSSSSVAPSLPPVRPPPWPGLPELLRFENKSQFSMLLNVQLPYLSRRSFRLLLRHLVLGAVPAEQSMVTSRATVPHRTPTTLPYTNILLQATIYRCHTALPYSLLSEYALALERRFLVLQLEVGERRLHRLVQFLLLTHRHVHSAYLSFRKEENHLRFRIVLTSGNEPGGENISHLKCRLGNRKVSAICNAITLNLSKKTHLAICVVLSSCSLSNLAAIFSIGI